MSPDLLTIVQGYQPQKVELWERTSLLATHSFQGGDLLGNIQSKGVTYFFPHLHERQKLVLFGKICTITLTHHGQYYKLSTQRHGEESWNVTIPILSRLPSSPEVISISKVKASAEEPLISQPTNTDSLPVEVETNTDSAEPLPRSFGTDFAQYFGVKDGYVAGAMAGGIASVELVQSMSAHGRLAFFGAGGLPVDVVEREIISLSSLKTPFGCNLLCNIHQPQEEERLVDVLLHNKITLISASAYAQLTTALLRYRLCGIFEQPDGSIAIPNRVIAKVSHPAVAQLFLSPPPQKMVSYLEKEGKISKAEAALAHRICIADAITVEADSGGHTDNRPLSVILPSIKRLADRSRYSVFVGAAGGLGTPQAMAAAVSLGADYLVMGSIHQSCIEAGTSDLVKQMLCRARITDTDMGIAPDMFERGSKVQVLTAGSLYAPRSRKLRELYIRYSTFEEIPDTEKKKLSRLIFRDSHDAIWQQTKDYWQEHDPKQLERAARVPKHKLALLFRWYLGQSSRWARQGIAERKQDFQVWCGPSMGAFNEWAIENGFDNPESRKITDVSDALWNQLISIQ